jgi:hypothetical protein
MFAPLVNGVRADIDQQIDWAKAEVRRQTRYTVMIGVLTGMGALATLGAIIVGLIALYLWLTPQTGAFTALGAIGGGLLLLALMLFVSVLAWRRPRIASRPRLQFTQPMALLRTLRRGSYDKVIAGGEQMLKLATSTPRHGSRSALLGALVLAAIMGAIAGRTL